ncbi:threonine/serine exporter family protein [Lactobacillus sp. DCY120]|uniref:Threonine/serine exporter family protein n=1 Tax=Bombilactobacillus apium TaxID=2675299 RepID=A0A850R2K9_9LACO|nr:threonine/serine exporter family protein [Bombilactobacillus apium]NVY97153.1 threonine/serine exporter family protein [Bombilactobacillus apium]
MNISLQIGIQIIFSAVATMGYGIFVNIPRQALLPCGCSGTIGWLVYWYFVDFVHAGRVFSSLVAALIVGLVSYGWARGFKMPATLFNVPALVPLVPGVPAYQAVRAMVMGQFVNSVNLFIMVILIMGAIALGYLMAQVLIDIVHRY